ncbi:MAG TPA: hypothetical protein ACFYEK_11865 [Candidatus Wunengus sp. YC60]
MKNLPGASHTYDGMTFEEILDMEAKRLLNDKDLLESIHSESIKLIPV